MMAQISVFSDLKEVLEYLLIPMLLGTGVWLTFRLGFVQFRYFLHGIAVASGRYDDPNAEGDVTHFQALTTALSATVGIGNIAGVAIALHWGGPGAIFWMWVTAFLGMATKFTEVTLAQQYRKLDESGAVLGGPMYYIENGLGKRWKPLAIFFAFSLMMTAFITGNAVQANTAADLLRTVFQIPPVLTGFVLASLIGLVIIGGIRRISKITQVLAPLMATLYVGGGLCVLYFQLDDILPAFQLILREAFNPTAGVAGTGAGVFLQTLLWGVRRGLFSNEAGQGSAPIAHAAAKTDQPVSEGVVALLEPFIDTLLICTITALVIITTGVWNKTTPTLIDLNSGDVSFVEDVEKSFQPVEVTDSTTILVQSGIQTGQPIQLAWHEIPVKKLFVDSAMTKPFDGQIIPAQSISKDLRGRQFNLLYGNAVENGAPLTMWAYTSALGKLGGMIVVFCVLLFGVSTAISWSYYGDRCVTYLFGTKAILPYRVLYIGFHFLGAILALNTIWDMGDVAMSLATLPNVLSLVLLSGLVRTLLFTYSGEHEEK